MEKRSNTRVIFDVRAIIKYQDKTIECRVANLSLHGALFQIQEEIPQDTIIDVSIYMEGTTSQLTIDLEGKVTRSDKSGIAIVFKSIDLDSFIHLRNIVAYNEGDDEKIMKEFYNSVRNIV